ncbi:tRNA lysidine(34) synthetase TilS [Rhizomicrobium electricum]|uniref:tRNA lysidine(34) synthetase TilS n=1 Tax=Rhizomicrobium electricum TaxID=480070 RepID=UPI00141F1EC1|nr:tRNA lysidine(34) synthetase TilS [Rhizomicrobium electricum]NIJ50033.1 tRNA(Ile)-lysidine synthetase-like protein [Rhizomicrobium electricum]
MTASGAPWPAAVAVSGGSDSLALMHLLRDWAKARALAPPVVVTVDHGLRPEAAVEAKKVVRWARKCGLQAHVLASEAPPPIADIEASARKLRYRLIGAFCRKKKLAAVYVAHTRDDQAETILMRLARGSGVDGLAGMRPLAPYPDPDFAAVSVVRPLLGIQRHALRDLLLARRQTWIEDPMNADARFARVRVRLAWPQLAPLGLTPERLAETAIHLARARESLEIVSQAVLTRACQPCRGGFAVDSAALASAPLELGLRALAKILMTVSRNPYRPRFDRLSALLAAITGNSLGGGRTLHGCRVGPAPKAARLFGPGTLLVEAEKGRSGLGKPRSGAK